jgi:hypothetical protein
LDNKMQSTIFALLDKSGSRNMEFGI